MLRGVDNGDPRKEVGQLGHFRGDRHGILCDGCLFKPVADCADLIEAVPPAVALHAMPQQADRGEVTLLQAGLDRRKISPAVGENTALASSICEGWMAHLPSMPSAAPRLAPAV